MAPQRSQATPASSAFWAWGNLTVDGRIDPTGSKLTDLAADKFERYTVRRGDLLFNRTNSPDLVGKTAVYGSDVPMAYAGYLIRVRFNDEVDSHYVAGYLNSGHGKTVLRNMCKSIIGMANINAKGDAEDPHTATAI